MSITNIFNKERATLAKMNKTSKLVKQPAIVHSGWEINKMKKLLKAEEQFKVGVNDIGWVGNDFQTHFYGMEFELTKPKLQIKVLEKPMTDKEILAELKPQECTLGDLLFALKSDLLLKNGYANIFYIRDKTNTLWAVSAFWFGFRRCWLVGALSVEDPRRWGAGDQVLSRKFSSSAIGSSDYLSLATRKKELLESIETEVNDIELGIKEIKDLLKLLK